MRSRACWAMSAAPAVPNGSRISKVVAMAGREKRSNDASGSERASTPIGRASASISPPMCPAARNRCRGRKKSRRFIDAIVSRCEPERQQGRLVAAARQPTPLLALRARRVISPRARNSANQAVELLAWAEALLALVNERLELLGVAFDG